jgi:hypothetical protein
LIDHLLEENRGLLPPLGDMVADRDRRGWTGFAFCLRLEARAGREGRVDRTNANQPYRNALVCFIALWTMWSLRKTKLLEYAPLAAPAKLCCARSFGPTTNSSLSPVFAFVDTDIVRVLSPLAP